MFTSSNRRGSRSQAVTPTLRHPSSSSNALHRTSLSISPKQPSFSSPSTSNSVSSPPDSRPRLRPPSKNKHPPNRPYSAVNTIRARPPPQYQDKTRFSTSTTPNPLDPSRLSKEIAPGLGPRPAAPPSSKRSLDSATLRLQLSLNHKSCITPDLGPDIRPEPLHSRPLPTFHSMASTLLSEEEDPFAHPSLSDLTPQDPPAPSQFDSRDDLISALQSILGPSRLASLVHLPTLQQPPSDELLPPALYSTDDPISSSPSKPPHPQNSKRFLKRFGWRSRSVVPKTNSPACTPLASNKPSPVPFRLVGVPLSHTAPASCITVIGGQKHLLPVMVFKTVEEIYSRGMRTPGLFKTSGNSARIETLLHIFESPPSYGDLFSLHDETVSDICGLLKRFLCALPQPLLDPALSELFWNACVNEQQGSGAHSLSARIAIAQIIFRLLPKRAFSLLVYVTAFLSQVPLFSGNKATLATIARIFGPALLAPRNAGVLGLGPSLPGVVQTQPPSVRQFGPAETTRRAADGLIWLLNHWNQITDGILDEDPQDLSSQPSLLRPSSPPLSPTAKFFTKIAPETESPNAEGSPEETEMIGIATSPRGPSRLPGAPLRQPVSETYARRQGSSLHMSSSLSRKASSSTPPEVLSTRPIVEELKCSGPGQPIPRHSFDSNTSQASTTLTRATLSLSDLAQLRPNESIVEELSDAAQPLNVRPDSRASQASDTPVACRQSTQPPPTELVIEELNCSNLIDVPSGRPVSSASLASTTSVTDANTSPSLQLFPPLRSSSASVTSSAMFTSFTATPSDCSSLPLSPPAVLTSPRLSKSSSLSTPPPPLLVCSSAVETPNAPTSGTGKVSASLPISSSLPLMRLSTSSLLPRTSSMPRATRGCEQTKSVTPLSTLSASVSSTPRRRAVTLNPTRQRSPRGSIALTFPDAQSIVDQYEAHGPSSLRRHPTLDKYERPISPAVSSSNCRFCVQSCGTSNSCVSLAPGPQACGLSIPSSRSLFESPKLTKADSPSRPVLAEVGRVQEEEEEESNSSAGPMAALSALLRTKDATIRAQSETIRAQADLLVESERRLAQWKSDHCRALEEEKPEGNRLNHLLSPVLSALQAGPSDLRVTCEAALVRVREAWEAERAAVQAQHAKLQFQLVETRKNYERVCDQLAVVRRAIGSDSLGA